MSSKKNSTEDYSAQMLEIRDSISEIDGSLISLLAKRRKLSIDVANIKQAIDKPLRDQQRERELLESLVTKASRLNIESRYITKIFSAIIEDSVRYQQEFVQDKISPSTKNSIQKTVAILGGVGAYSHIAAKQFFANSNNHYDACDSFQEIIQKVESGMSEFGVIPIENTTSGGITEVYDLLLGSKLNIIGEEKLAINHCLVTRKQLQLNQIRNIVAHPQAARQCSQDLEKLTNAKISLCESTAHALALVSAEENLDTAAIASEQAAELFNLQVLQKNIANQKRNFTRFMVLSKAAIPVALTVQSKTTIALSTGQQPGSLTSVLTLFENANIPLSKLESRPIPEKPWEQLFYIDFQGNIGQPHVADTLTSLSKLCKFLKVFGSYPSENIVATKVPSDSFANASLKRAELNQKVKTETRKRVSPSEALQESTVDLAGTMIGKDDFIVSPLIQNIHSEQGLDEQFNHLSECGLSSIWFKGILDLQEGTTKLGSNEYSISKIESLANRHQLSLIFSVESSEELELVVAHHGIPRIAISQLEQKDLLDSVGSLTTPVVIQLTNNSYDKLLDTVEKVLEKGNQQVVLELTVDCEKYSPAYLTNIVELRNSTHLPIVVSVVGEKIELQVLPSIVSGMRALGVNGVVLNLADNSECNEKLMITAKEFAVIMTKL